MSPEVVTQLRRYSEWLSQNETGVREAFVENCKVLKDLHVIARTIRPDIGPPGERHRGYCVEKFASDSC